MKTLGTRLVLALLLTLFSFWGVWIAWQIEQVTRERTGAWDTSLEVTAQHILLALPANLDRLGIDPAASSLLSARAPLKDDKFSFQVWTHDPRVNILHSPTAPNAPFKADFRDGFSSETVAGEMWRVYALTDSTGRIQVQAAKRDRQLRDGLVAAVSKSLVMALLTFLLLSCAVWGVIRWSLRPVSSIQKLIASRNPLDLTPLPADNVPGEIQPLVGSFNGLLRQLDHAVQAERRFIAEAAHELRTPLAALMAHAQLALDAADFETGKASLRQLVKGVERSTRLSEQLLDSARLDARKGVESKLPVAAHELVSVVVHDFELVARQRRQLLALHAEPAEILGSLDDLGVLVRNLVDNACRYSGEGSRIAISCACVAHERACQVRISVADDGPGIPREHWPRIFDRFYRVPGTQGRGSGIGLSLAARIADLHEARLDVDTGLDDRGLRVSVWFPCARPATASRCCC